MNASLTPSASVAERLGLGQSPMRRGRARRWLLAAGIALVAVLAAALWLARRDAGAVRYATQPVIRGGLVLTVSATGSLAPTNKVDVGSELSGIVRIVSVDVDDRVTAGQRLAQLDTTRLKAQEMQARASLTAAESQVLQRQATLEEAMVQLARLERAGEAARSLIASEQELTARRATVKRADADVASAKAAVMQARAALDAIQTDLGKAWIHSPIDGVVLTRTVEPGQTVAASFQAPVLFTIAEDLTQMQLTINVDEADVGRLQPGQPATFTVDAYADRVFEASVDEIRFASQTVSGVVTYPTILYVGNPELLLRPGMTATAEIVVREVEDALLVPNAALRYAPAAAAPARDAGGGTVIGRLMPRRPGRMQATRGRPASDSRVWVLRNGEASAVRIRAGVTDGVNTEVAEVLEGELDVGMALIVDASEG